VLRLRDIMTTDIVSFAPDMTLREATVMLTARHITGAPVIAGSKVVGLLSVTDILDFITTEYAAAESDEDVCEWRDDVDENLVAEGLEIPDDQWTSGQLDVVARIEGQEQPGDPLDRHTVAELMTRELHALPASTPVEEAAAFMRRAKVHRVLALIDGVLGGIVTTSDITRAVSERRLAKDRLVRTIRRASRKNSASSG
jgi:predicted transcriptional regulator